MEWNEICWFWFHGPSLSRVIVFSLVKHLLFIFSSSWSLIIAFRLRKFHQSMWHRRYKGVVDCWLFISSFFFGLSLISSITLSLWFILVTIGWHVPDSHGSGVLHKIHTNESHYRVQNVDDRYHPTGNQCHLIPSFLRMAWWLSRVGLLTEFISRANHCWNPLYWSISHLLGSYGPFQSR